MGASSYSYAFGPLMALIALGVVLLLCRWVFAPPPEWTKHRRNQTRTAARPAGPPDYGLLRVAATVRTSDDARMLAGVLKAAGIRCTVADGRQPDTFDLLVFAEDFSRARSLVGSEL